MYAAARTPTWPVSYYVANMDAVRAQLRRPAVWLVPVVVAAVQLAGSAGPRHGPDRAGGADLHLVPLNWFGYLLLIAGPVALLLRTVYPYAVLLAVLAITVTYQVAGFGYGPIFVSLIVAFLTAAAVGPRWRTYPLPVLGWVGAGVAGAAAAWRGSTTDGGHRGDRGLAAGADRGRRGHPAAPCGARSRGGNARPRWPAKREPSRNGGRPRRGCPSLGSCTTCSPTASR